MLNLKKEAARTAVTLITDQSIVGLGAGETMQYAADFLADRVNDGLNIQLVTSSAGTQRYLLQLGLAVQPIKNFSSIDIYFDGCDQFDKHLNALKSGGGIHTMEKLLAAMAKEFFLVGDALKYEEALTVKFPLVIEVLPDAGLYVQDRIVQIFQ